MWLLLVSVGQPTISIPQLIVGGTAILDDDEENGDIKRIRRV